MEVPKQRKAPRAFVTSVASWRHLVTLVWIDVGSGKGLLPVGNKTLPEPTLTYTLYYPLQFPYEHLFSTATIREVVTTEYNLFEYYIRDCLEVLGC